MPSKPTRWLITGARRPFVPAEFEIDVLASDEVVGEVVGCRMKVAPRSEINQVFESILSGARKRRAGSEIDFIALRQALAANTPWSDVLTQSIQPRARA